MNGKPSGRGTPRQQEANKVQLQSLKVSSAMATNLTADILGERTESSSIKEDLAVDSSTEKA